MSVRPDSFSAYRYQLVLEKDWLIQEQEGLDWRKTRGVLRQLAGDPKRPLSPKQLHHWSEAILPVVNVACEGPIGFHDDDTSSCVSEAPLNDEEFRDWLDGESCLCHSCRFDVQRFLSSD
jgi:hypothetical protein